MSGYLKKLIEKCIFTIVLPYTYNILINRLTSQKIKHKKLFIGEKWQISLIFFNQVFYHNLFDDQVFMGHCIFLFILYNNFRGWYIHWWLLVFFKKTLLNCLPLLLEKVFLMSALSASWSSSVESTCKCRKICERVYYNPSGVLLRSLIKYLLIF